MNLHYQELLPPGFAASSRVWIYQSNRAFTASEAEQIDQALGAFVKGWQSHGTPVTGYGKLFFRRFIVLMADETASGVSGCSTDSSVRVIKQLEEQYGVNLFNRQLLAFVIKDQVQILPLSQLNYSVENNFIDAETVYFNNIVQTKQELLDNWIIPVKDSWFAGRIKLKSEAGL